MSIFAVIIFLLASICATVGAILGVAWWSFGRARHARTWALSSGFAAIGWAVYLAGLLSSPDPLWYELFSAGLITVSSAILLGGFRERAGLPRRAAAIAGVATGIVAIIFLGGLLLDSATLVNAPPLAFTGVCLFGCIVTLLPTRRRSTVAERTAAILIGCSALFHVAAALFVVALIPVHAAHSGALFRLSLMLGLPSGVVGNGFSCVLLLAADLADRMRALAATDPLTGALNRRGLDHSLAPTIANCRRRGEPIALVLADLDRFKAINDRLGHAVGDAVLQRFAAYVTSEIRAGDLFARIGGEEFAIVLPGTSCESAADAIDRVRAGVAALWGNDAAPLTLTASFGITTIEPDDDGIAPALDRADRALYASKLAGRDRVTIADAIDAMIPPLALDVA